MLFGVLSAFLNCLSVGATSWYMSDSQRNGLWDACYYDKEEGDTVIFCRKISPPGKRYDIISLKIRSKYRLEIFSGIFHVFSE